MAIPSSQARRRALPMNISAFIIVRQEDIVVRILLLLFITLVGGAAGFFTGAYLFNWTHPVPPMPAMEVPTGPDFDSQQFRSLQRLERAGADALDRHMARHSWLHGGSAVGAGLGFFGTILVSRVVRKREPR
jgi:hypothetical protein